MPNSSEVQFGGSGITLDCYLDIENRTSYGARILEFGSGDVSTKALSPRNHLISVEHNTHWVNKYPTADYVHVNLKAGFYDIKALNRLGLPFWDYDLVLFDGPVGSEARMGFLSMLNLLHDSATYVINNTDRAMEQVVASVYADRFKKRIINRGEYSVLV